MGGISSKISLGLATCVAAVIGLTGIAGAATTVEANPSCCTFQGSPFVQGLGEVANFVNAAEVTPHDATSTQAGPDGQPLFYSEVIVGGQSSPIAGTEYLQPGTYPFYCTIHGSAMSGDLTIENTGTVVPRPSVQVSVVAQKLKSLRKSGVRVKVTAKTAGKGISVVATKGKIKIGSKAGITLAAGKSKVYTLPLTKAGRKAVRKGKVVQVSVKSTVPFGKASSATRKVR